MENQDKDFFDYEGDNWFKRNKHSLRQATDKDAFLYLIDLYGLKPKKSFGSRGGEWLSAGGNT